MLYWVISYYLIEIDTLIQNQCFLVIATFHSKYVLVIGLYFLIFLNSLILYYILSWSRGAMLALQIHITEHYHLNMF